MLSRCVLVALLVLGCSVAEAALQFPWTDQATGAGYPAAYGIVNIQINYAQRIANMHVAIYKDATAAAQGKSPVGGMDVMVRDWTETIWPATPGGATTIIPHKDFTAFFTLVAINNPNPVAAVDQWLVTNRPEFTGAVVVP